MMKFRTISLVVAVGMGLTLAGPAPAAMASKAMDVGPVGSGGQNLCAATHGTLGSAWVTLAGDYVTIRDLCSDGRAVEGRVGMRINGEARFWYCVNNRGGGTEVVCDFDWPEGYVGFKTIHFYSAPTPGAKTTELGQLAHWRDG